MAERNLVLQLLITAKDTASSVLSGVVGAVKFLDSEISVVAGKIREKFSDLFGGGLEGATEFEVQLDKVRAKGDYTAESMEQLKKSATDIGAQFGITGTEAAQGLEALAAAGLTATQAMQALPSVLALAKAEGISMDVAAERLSDSLSIVGLGFEEAGRMADVLAKGANVSTTEATALAQALSTAGGIAKTAGLDLEQTVGALSAFANAGIKGEKAGTALAAILTQLTNPASNASKELSALGITSRDLGDVIGQLAAKGDASNTAILAFGETAGPGLRALIGQGQQSLDALTGQLRDADGAAQQAADGISGNFQGAMKGLESTWENIKTALMEPVLEPLTKAAKDAAAALNTTLNDGSLKPIQAAIGSFVTNTVQAAKDFIAAFDFKPTGESLHEFAAGAEEAFGKIGQAGRNAADVVIIGWNAMTAGFRTAGSVLLAVAASAVQTLANMEEAASKIGLGTQQRANELRETANSLQAKASELIQQVATDGREMQAAYARLTSSATDAAEANRKLKDSLPAAELQEIKRSLEDYTVIAARANAAAQQAKKDFWDSKISMEAMVQAADAAALANQELATATAAAQAESSKAAEQHKKTAVELEAEATSSQKAADRYGEYVGALEQSGNAQAAALRSEIALAQAKGDTITVAAKSVELAKLEAETSTKVAEAKKEAAKAAQIAVKAQEAYLKSIGGGTEAQKVDLEVQKARAVQMLAESAQATADAEIKDLLAKKIKNLTDAKEEDTGATRINTAAAKEGAEATKEQAKTYTLMEDAATHALRELSGLSDGMNRLVSEMTRTDDIGKRFGHQFRDELGKLQSQLQNVNSVIEHNSSIIGTNADAFERNANIANTARKMYLEQAVAATELAGRLTDISESGDASAGSLEATTREAERAATGFDLLDQQTLDRLQSAIDSANEKLRQMQEETQDARDEIARLNAEIAEESGQSEKAALLKQQLDYQTALADIEAKRAEAEAAGNRELIALYAEQARKLAELNSLKEKNIKADAEAKRQQESNNNTSTTSGTNNTKTTSSGGGISSGGNTTTVNNYFNVDSKDLLSEQQIRTKVLPVLDRTLRLRS